MATIIELPRKNGSAWRAQVRRPGRPTQTETFDTKQDAQNWADGEELNIKLRRVDPQALAEKHYLSDVIELYRRKVIEGSKNEKDTTRLLAWWKKQLGSSPLSAIDAIGIDMCLDNLKCKEQTKNRYLGALSGCLTFISKTPYQYIHGNPCKAVTRRKEGKARQRILTSSEMDTLFKAADMAAAKTSTKTQTKQLPTFLRLAYETGRRRGELLKLRWVDVDFDEGVLHLMDTKSGKDQESVIEPQVVEMLKQHETDFRKAGFKYIFRGRFPNKATSFDVVIAGLIKSLFEPDRYDEMPVFHSIRHTVATQMGDGGATEAQIMSVTGHSSSASVNRYVKKTREAAREGQSKRKRS